MLRILPAGSIRAGLGNEAGPRLNKLETRAHELLDQLDSGKLAAVVQLLEVMIHNGDEDELTEEDRRAITASRDYFRHGGERLSFEQVAAECGFTMDQVRDSQTE